MTKLVTGSPKTASTFTLASKSIDFSLFYVFTESNRFTNFTSTKLKPTEHICPKRPKHDVTKLGTVVKSLISHLKVKSLEQILVLVCFAALGFVGAFSNLLRI